MQMAIDVAGFTPAEADQLRQAMGSKRSAERMERLRDRLYEGMAERGITGERRRGDLRQARGVRQLRLPREPLGELRLPRVRELVDQAHYPAAFLRRAAQRAADGLLLAADARATTPAGTAWRCAGPTSTPAAPRRCWSPRRRPGGAACRASRRTPGGWAARRYGSGWAASVPSARTWPSGSRRSGPRTGRTGTCRTWPAASVSPPRSWRRWPPPDAFACFGLTRRQALWAAGAAAQDRPGRLPGTVTGADAPTAARHGRGGPPGRRPLGHRPVPGEPPGPVRPGPARRAGRGADRPARPGARPGSGSGSAGWSPTGSARRPPAGSRSSTWRTRPECSMSLAPRGCGSATVESPAPVEHWWCGAGCSGTRASRTSPRTGWTRSSPPSHRHPGISVDGVIHITVSGSRRRETPDAGGQSGPPGVWGMNR